MSPGSVPRHLIWSTVDGGWVGSEPGTVYPIVEQAGRFSRKAANRRATVAQGDCAEDEGAAMKKAPAREDGLIEMLDGRMFWSDDNWVTIWARSRDGKRWRRVPEDSVDLVRFIAVSQSSWQGDAF